MKKLTLNRYRPNSKGRLFFNTKIFSTIILAAGIKANHTVDPVERPEIQGSQLFLC